jgi:hypothetical protein
MENFLYLWKMLFFHIHLSSSHDSFNDVTPSGGSKISGGFGGDCDFSKDGSLLANAKK